ncbi:MAG: AAA family ATPase, partial [Prevotella sp.]|nr:AAA family ATPase [Prevotella sp.]
VPAEKLLKIGVPEELIPKVCKIETLNGLDKMEEYLPTDAYENLFNLMDGADIDEIIAEIEEGKAKENQDKQLSDNNKRRFVELTDDDELQRIIEQDMEAWQLFLHPSQRKLVDTDYKGTMKVSGGAGTGKTVAAMHRLKYLCGNKDAKVLFTTYTKTLKENLGSLLKKMDINIRRYTLNNIDQVLLDVARNYFIKERYKILDYSGDEESLKLWREVLETEVTEFDEKFLYDEYIDVIVYYGISDSRQYLMQARVGRTKALSRKQRIEVWRLVEKYVKLKEERKVVDRLELFNEVTKYLNENNVRPYTNVIADEFQDFSNPELKFLRALVAEGENDLFLTGDPMQRIYSGRKINFRAAGINVRGVRSKRLKVNYRTTEPIKRVAVSVVKGQKYDDMDGGSESMKGYISLIRGGEAPVYTMVNNVTEEVEQVIEWINGCKESDIPLKDICVATPVSNQARELKSRLHHENIPFKEIRGYSPVGSMDGISLCTFHSLKGLEFRVIILMGVNERNIPSKETNGYPFFTMDALEKKEYLSSRRSLLYVAITRARALVYMVGYGEACGLIRIKS